jgi:nitrate/TMAO reductase-like tetraheme cytochrome c subunit
MEPLITRTARLLRPAAFLGHNALSMAGVVLTTSSAITMIAFWFLEALGDHVSHPYAGILFFIVLPAFFVLGLVLIPVGVAVRRRKLLARGELPHQYPQIDLGKPFYRNALALVAGLTLLNVVIFGTATYKGVEYVDSSEFCGTTCHNVMQPQWTAFVDSPHARVGCVGCHVGPGPGSFVRAKLSGVRQVIAMFTKSYSRPIPSPVHDLRPARETCEQCHWPAKFHGDKFVVRTHFSEDEANTRLTTILVLKIGGRSFESLAGIHGRHLNEGSRIGYTAIDDKRQVIPRVTWVDDDGKSVEFVSTDIEASAEELAAGETRIMDCVDCHNRPTHAFVLPERAVDGAIEDGRISSELPYVRKKAVEILRGEYESREQAGRDIPKHLNTFYRTDYPDVYRQHRARVERAGNELAKLYLASVFPDMGVTWGSYVNNIGHEDFLGCFRCHDDTHESSDGRSISQDCDACHTILAMEEENPELLASVGY